MKARIQALATSSLKSSKSSQPKDSYETHEPTRYPLTLAEGVIHETAPHNAQVQSRPKATSACLAESVADIKDPVTKITIPIEPPTDTLGDTPTAPFDFHTTLLGRTAVPYAASRAFNQGLPAPDREGLIGLCDEISPGGEQGVIMWSLEGTYVPRGVPKGWVTRFVETGLLDGGMEPEVQEEEEDVMAVDMATRGAMGARSLRNTMRRGRKWGWSRQDRLIKV